MSSIGQVLELGQVVKDTVHENYVAKMLAVSIVDNHMEMSEEDLQDAIFSLVTEVAAFTATRLTAHLLGEQGIDDLVEGIVELTTLEKEIQESIDNE